MSTYAAISLRTLRRGMSGNDVHRLQTFLIGQGVFNGVCDGDFGTHTEQAVITWQLAHGLTDDGIAGRKTLATMMTAGLPCVADCTRDGPERPSDIEPLPSNFERQKRFGKFEYRSKPERDNPEAIEILGDWEAKNIVIVQCPVFHRRVRFHHDVAPAYVAAMQAVIDAGLADRLLTFDGSFVPRFQRGSRTSLSNHSWGTAFDVNCEWNGLGRTPAYIGEKGSVREIVPIMNAHRFFWGGHFKKRLDGMHFEHVG